VSDTFCVPSRHWCQTPFAPVLVYAALAGGV